MEATMIEETLFQHHFPRGEYQDILFGPDGNIVWQTPWQSNLIVNGLGIALAALMKGEGNRLTFWAVGSGEEEWDGPTPNLPSEKDLLKRDALYNETSRKEIPRDKIETNPLQTNQLQIRMDFIASDIPSDKSLSLREFGLFAGGSIDPDEDLGILINHRIHPRIDLQEGFTLQRTLRLTF
jgi:hypothetical protein